MTRSLHSQPNSAVFASPQSHSPFQIALLMIVCESEEAIAWDTLSSLAEACAGAKQTLFLIDDASPSGIGNRLSERFRETTGQAAECYELRQSLGFYGMAHRLFLGLSRIAATGRPFDMVIKIDPDACIVRRDLLPFLREICPEGVGLFGESWRMRRRDAALLLADLLPFGFKRKSVGDIIYHDWQLRRLYSVWWSDFGRRALLRGFRFGVIVGGFFFLGGKTLDKLASAGWLTRDQRKHGFTFCDDTLMTIAAYAVGDPVIDLRMTSSQWGFLAITEESPLESIVPYRPYVVHCLKDRPKAWEHRRKLRAALYEPSDSLSQEREGSLRASKHGSLGL